MMDLLRDKWLQSSWAPVNLRNHHAEVQWNNANLNKAASNIRDIFCGIKHIIEVDHLKIYAEHHGMHGWLLPKSFRDQYCFPNRDLGDHAVVHLMRGMHTGDEKIFEVNEFGGDAVFVGTNNEEDAIMIALKYK